VVVRVVVGPHVAAVHVAVAHVVAVAVLVRVVRHPEGCRTNNLFSEKTKYI
jgi:hypothetical protein